MSGTLRTLLAERATELLGDGQWHPYEPVLSEIAKLIPPGAAIRRTEAIRLRNGGPPVRYQTLPIERQIASGARVLAREFLSTKVFEIDGLHPTSGAGKPRNPNKRIRMVHEHRALRSDPLLRQISRLTYENELLRDQVLALSLALRERGHGDIVDVLVPQKDEGDAE